MVILERTCEASQSVVICEGTCGAFDPNDGLVWGELVETIERVVILERTCGEIQPVVTIGANVWSDQTCGHLRED